MSFSAALGCVRMRSPRSLQQLRCLQWLRRPRQLWLMMRMLGWRRAHLFSATSLSVSRACEVFVFANEKTSM